MATPSTPAEIDAFVKRVIGWSQLVQQYGDAALQAAHDQYQQGKVPYTAYSGVLQQKIAVTESCYTMTNAASNTLLQVALGDLAPITGATDKLAQAADSLEKMQDGVLVASELVIAAAALATAIGTPGMASIAAAGSAVYVVAAQVLKDAGVVS